MDTGEGLASKIFEYAKRIPAVKRRVDAEYAKMMGDLRAAAKPYGDEFPSCATLPEEGREHAEILAQMQAFREREASRWQDGYVSGAVYHGDPEHIALMEKAYSLHSQTNPLHSDLWPSITKYEAEVVSMTAKMLGADLAGDDAEVCGAISSGGTESILLAMKTYRDQARAERGVTRPNIVAPISAHAAFDKAARYFGIELRKIHTGPDFRADLRAMRRAVDRNTICLVGSAPCFPHGVIDPITELAELALAKGVGLHVDACLGGFVLPWAKQLGYDVPDFDFRVPGVTSMSADTHKYGYAAKGTSVVLYRSKALRRHQWFTLTDWPGGIYFSPTFAGSRSGGVSAACWAAMQSMGRKGYLDASKAIVETGQAIRRGIADIPQLKVLGDPLWVISFAASDPAALDIYRVSDAMSHRRWNLNGLHRPPCVHIAVTLRHTQEGVVERFLADLRESVAEVEASGASSSEGGMAPVYGLAGTIPARGAVSDLLELYLDALYEV
ncbi:aminotransferase class V-fold PLP-dependent enzyme [Pseudenhygromyxa sp. WMMC2535]|uniref:aminotransferase class V-fold PLP-dependent enzyme n=1 Tax=Pseudenhygromyxa sp. WMMC2535 TaxID=2712867 RepID=UPI0015520B95|nr:aminotransferase class V-fold PLP-dependent enzyme [Pseudenhygromyxa sp. WMMC2535]NVB42771.1 aminotransferase class V-fold PLP-dependent enzyme [Pseudenhygromyxa sp. WMMC2535]